MHHGKLRLRTIIVLTALGLAVSFPTTATASSPHEVDPLSLTPALNPAFTWTCFEAGAGIVCRGERSDVYGPDPIGFDCDGQPVSVSGRGEQLMTRWHTADGLATRTMVNISYDDRITLAADGSGPAVRSTQHWNRHYVYNVAGDPSSRILTETGRVLTVFAPDGGKIWQVTGYTEFAPGEDFETVVAQHGRDDFASGGDFVEAVCDALT